MAGDLGLRSTGARRLSATKSKPIAGRAEIENYGLRAVGFVTGGGNMNLAKYRPATSGQVHRLRSSIILFNDGAADELRRAVNEDGLMAYKLLAPALWIGRSKTKRVIRSGKPAPSLISRS